MIDSIVSLCRSYADHVGLSELPGGLRNEVASRLSRWPVWARWSVGLIAWSFMWVAPMVLLGRMKRFDSLLPEDKEALLERLQQARSPLLRGAFIMIKTIVLGVCYSSRAALATK